MFMQRGRPFRYLRLHIFAFSRVPYTNACAFQCKMQYTMHINWMVHRNKLFQIEEGNYLNISHNKEKIETFLFQ